MELWTESIDWADRVVGWSGSKRVCETKPMALWVDYVESAGMVWNRWSHGGLVDVTRDVPAGCAHVRNEPNGPFFRSA
jgi:hypothetical protein